MVSQLGMDMELRMEQLGLVRNMVGRPLGRSVGMV